MRPKSTQVESARRVLFGESSASGELTAAALKRMYRQRALEMHPDRARVLGLDDAEATRRTQELNTAYSVVAGSIAPGASGGSAYPEPPPAGPRPPTREQFWTAGVPSRPLRFGQYLYFRGVVSWQRYIDALVWQRKHHVPFGEVAVEAGALSRDLLERLLSGQTARMRLGERAVAAGIMTETQSRAVVAEQRLRCRPLGYYFIERRILGRTRVTILAAEQKKHNTEHG